MADQPDIEVEKLAAPERERFGQLVAVAIVVTTLLAALCGYLQAHALTHNGDALVRAQQWSAFASLISDQDQQAQQLLKARDQSEQSARLEGAYNAGQARFAGQRTAATSFDESQGLTSRIHVDTQQLAAGLRSEYEAVRRIDSGWLSEPDAMRVGDGKSCPTGAPNAVPASSGEQAKFVANDKRTVYQLDGLREAANTEASAAEKQFTRYAVSLAILAVAVFLLGYSLTPHGRHHRKLYALTAGVLVLGSTLWGVYAAVKSPQKASAAAMAAYADGRVSLDNSNYGLSIRYFNCSIGQQADFASAYQWRSNAYLGNSNTTFLVSNQNLDRSIADAQTARSLGDDDPDLLNTLSTGLDVAGVRHRNIGQIEQAAQLLRAANGLAPGDPTITMNLAESQLTLGREWKRAFAKAEQVEASVNDTSASLSELSSLTDLWDSPLGPRLRPALVLAKQHLVASLSHGQGAPMKYAPAPGTLTAGRTPSLSVSLRSRNGDIALSPGQAEFFIDHGSGFDPQRDTLYAVWYYRSAGSGWQALTGLTGPIVKSTPTEMDVSNSAPDQNRLFAIATRDPSGDCLASGEYKLELYVNGKFAGQASEKYSLSESRLTSTQLSDMNFSVCRPPTWKSVSGSQPGLIEGYVSPTKSPERGQSAVRPAAGILVVDASSSAPSPTAGGGLLDRVLSQLGGLLPGGLKTGQPTGNEFAGGMCNEYVEQDSYPNGVLAAGIGRDGYGRELVGIVYGPESGFATINDLFTGMAAGIPCTSS